MANVIDFKSDQMSDTILQLNQANQTLTELAGRASRLQNALGPGAWVRVNVQARLSTGTVSGANVEAALSALTRGINATSAKMGSLSSALRTTSNLMQETEARVGGKTMMSPAQAAQALHYPSDTSQWSNAMWDEYYKLAEGTNSYTMSDGRTIVHKEDGYYLYNADGTLIASLENDKDWHSSSMKYREYNSDGSFRESNLDVDLNVGNDIQLYEKKFKDLQKQPKDVTFYDKDGNLLKGDAEKAAKEAMERERVATIAEIEISGGEKKGLYGQDWSSKNDRGGSASLTVEAMTLEYASSIKGGLYVEKVGPDGKTHLSLSPGFAAEIGFDATASHMDAEISQKVLFGLAELSATGSVDVGHVGASAEGQLGMVDGKFAATVSAKAEANLVEMKASGSAEVLGVKGTVEGGLTVGVGGHAEIGYYDGHVKCDLGASLGIGVNVSVDLDVSGVVDGVYNLVTDPVGTVSGWCESAGEVLSKVAPWNWF